LTRFRRTLQSGDPGPGDGCDGLLRHGVPGAVGGICPPAPGIAGWGDGDLPAPATPLPTGSPASRDDMTPESKLKEGRPDEALQLLTAEVRNNPADAKRRVFL